jgi:hypothetical protein
VGEGEESAKVTKLSDDLNIELNRTQAREAYRTCEGRCLLTPSFFQIALTFVGLALLIDVMSPSESAAWRRDRSDFGEAI